MKLTLDNGTILPLNTPWTHVDMGTVSKINATDRLARFVAQFGKAEPHQVTYGIVNDIYDLDPDIRWAVGDVVPED